MKLTINSLDLAYTIDTYQMFNGESVLEGEQMHYSEEYELTDDETFNLSFDYDHKAIVQAFAEHSIAILENELTTGRYSSSVTNVVKGITLIKTGSPQFYNYSTDWYTAEWDIDRTNLEGYIAGHDTAFNEWRYESGWTSDDMLDTDKVILIWLDFYTRQELEVDTYDSQMWEIEGDVYYEHMTLDKESQALIDSKGQA